MTENTILALVASFLMAEEDAAIARQVLADRFAEVGGYDNLVEWLRGKPHYILCGDSHYTTEEEIQHAVDNYTISVVCYSPLQVSSIREVMSTVTSYDSYIVFGGRQELLDGLKINLPCGECGVIGPSCECVNVYDDDTCPECGKEECDCLAEEEEPILHCDHPNMRMTCEGEEEAFYYCPDCTAIIVQRHSKKGEQDEGS